MDVLEKQGKKVVLLGNEAIARGAMEAGVGVFSAYPGTPSSEVSSTMASTAKKAGFYFEYATNEKVAWETAAGAAWSGVRAMTAMKHFGMNVAADSLSPVVYAGTKAGLVLMVADDPNGWSSAQSEQDTRYFAKMTKFPCIEPSNPQEALEFTKMAFEFSEEFEIPFMLRTTTKVSHSVGTVKLGKIKKPKLKGKFVKDEDRFFNIRPNLQKLHIRVDKKLASIEKKLGKKLCKTIKGKGKIGVITNGVSYDYAVEAFKMLGLNVPILKIGLTNPLPRKVIQEFIKDKKEVLVLEELEPFIQDFVEQVSDKKLIIRGKDLLPNYGEYNLETIMPALEKVFKKKIGFNFKKHKELYDKTVKNVSPRKPVFCSGCPHRSTFYAVRKVFGDNAVYPGDIGCYTLGVFEPFKMQNTTVSMGASLGIGHGITRVSDQDVVTFIGDSTFFHAGAAGLANIEFHDGKSPLVVILDNSVTAMTGHQPHPGTGFTSQGEKVTPLNLEAIAKAYGAEVRVANAFHQEDLVTKLKELKKIKGPRVLISKGECRLYFRRQLRKKGITLPTYEIVTPDDQRLSETTDRFSCPAISEIRKKKGDKPKYVINPDLCWGCSVCMQIAPKGAIKPVVKK